VTTEYLGADLNFRHGFVLFPIAHHLSSGVFGGVFTHYPPSPYEIRSLLLSRPDLKNRPQIEQELFESVRFILAAIAAKCKTTDSRKNLSKTIAGITFYQENSPSRIGDLYWSFISVVTELGWVLSDIEELVTPSLLALRIPPAYRRNPGVNLIRLLRGLEILTRDFESHPNRAMYQALFPETGSLAKAIFDRESILLAMNGKYTQLIARYSKTDTKVNAAISNIAIASGASDPIQAWLNSREAAHQLTVEDLVPYIAYLRSHSIRVDELEMTQIKAWLGQFSDSKLLLSVVLYIRETRHHRSWGYELVDLVAKEDWAKTTQTINSLSLWLTEMQEYSKLHDFLATSNVSSFLDFRSLSYMMLVQKSKRQLTSTLEFIFRQVLENPNNYDPGFVWSALAATDLSVEELEKIAIRISDNQVQRGPRLFTGLGRNDYLSMLCELALFKPKCLPLIRTDFIDDPKFSIIAAVLSEIEVDYSGEILLSNLKENISISDWIQVVRSVIGFLTKQRRQAAGFESLLGLVIDEVFQLKIQLGAQQLYELILYLGQGGDIDFRSSLLRLLISSDQRNIEFGLNSALPSLSSRPSGNYALAFEEIAREEGIPLTSKTEGRLAIQDWRRGKLEQKEVFQGPDSSTWSSMRVILDDVIHELNQPLAAISNLVVGIQKKSSRKSEKLDFLEPALDGIKRNIERLEQRMSDYRSLTNQESDSGYFEVTQAARETIDSMRGTSNGGNIKIELDARQLEQQTYIFGDSFLFKQMLRNLIKNSINAINSAGKSGKVTINIAIPSRFSNDVLVTVSDNGPGIPEELREIIYNQGITTKPGHGLGLGLSLASSVAQGLGGSLRLRNTGKAGTIFVINLPTSQPGNAEDFENEESMITGDENLNYDDYDAQEES
jgi:signal transduction histidine kinase